MSSLRQQLAWSLGIGLAALFVVQWLVLSLVFREAAERYLAARLEADTETLLAALGFDPAGQLHLDATRLDPAFQRAFSGRYFVVATDGKTALRSRSLWDEDLELPRQDTAGAGTVRARGPQDQRLLVVSKAYLLHGHPLVVSVAEDVSTLSASLRGFQIAYGAASLAVLVVLVLLQRAVVARALRPLERVREELRRLHRGQIRRIEATAPGEIAPLVGELNGLLDVLGERLRRSREALGNLAHALKTHLAVFAHVLDCPEARPAVAEALQGPVAAMSRLVERELKRARLAGGPVPGERVDLREAIGELVDALRKIHADKRIGFDVQIPDGLVFEGDREDLLELAGNLIDNACKWCEREVRISAGEETGLVLRVEDDGPGSPLEDLAALTQRGMRGDDSKPGSGLGLAIADEVARSYGGTLRFGRSAELGGLRVEAILSSGAWR
jgi:signal transduction histidine kinase